MNQRSRPERVSQLQELASAERKEVGPDWIPELLEGETENQAALVMDRISGQVQRERAAARTRRFLISLVILALAIWLAWRAFGN